MQNAGFTFGKNIPLNEKTAAAQNGQANINPADVKTQQAQTASIFNKDKGSADINQSNNNSGGMGGVNIFAGGGGFVPTAGDTTSIFSGINKGSDYRLYSKKDYSFDVPKLTQEDIASQKNSDTPLRTNPKANFSHVVTKANPYEAFRNPEMQETSLADNIGNAFKNLFGQKKAD